MEAVRERTNFDLRLNMSKSEAEDKRLNTIAAIETTALETRKMLQLAARNPKYAGKRF